MTAQRRIIVVGVGALGSHLLLLSRNLPARFTAIDFDRVERKNTLSQLHSRMGLGRNKAKALQQLLQGLYGLRIDAVPHKLTEDNAMALLGGAALVVDCVDNAPTRRLICDVVRGAGIPCVHGALAADGAYARVMWDGLFTIDEGGEGEATCEDGAHLPFIAAAAAQLALTLQRFLEDGTQHSCHLHPGGVVHI